VLYTLISHLAEGQTSPGVFHSLSLRAVFALLTSMIVSLLAGPVLIRQLKAFQLGQMVRDDGPGSHKSKEGTPTLGGVLILAALALATVLWADLANGYIWLVLAVALSFGAVGFADDYLKIRWSSSRGLSARQKYCLQSVLGLVVGIVLFWSARSPLETALTLPVFKSFYLPLGFFFPFFVYLVIVGSSNAVNLTDGLDGLAALPVAMVGAGLGVFLYISGHADLARHANILHVPGTGELVVFAGALVGACLGFLWFNAHPAEIFMGDTGSLALGAVLGTLAVIVHQELVLFVMGGVFVAETISVILQVGFFKLKGRRIFRMAPLHHHFELKGWSEPQVVVRFWILSLVLVCLALATLNLR